MSITSRNNQGTYCYHFKLDTVASGWADHWQLVISPEYHPNWPWNWVSFQSEWCLNSSSLFPCQRFIKFWEAEKLTPKKMRLICLGQQPLSLSIKVFITAYKENESNLEEEKSPQSKREKALGEEYHQIWVIILPQDLVQRGTVINFPCKCTREQNVYKCIVGVQWRVQEHFFDCVSCGFLTHTITIFWLPWHICLSNVLLYFWQLVTFPFQSARFVQKLCVQWRN